MKKIFAYMIFVFITVMTVSICSAAENSTPANASVPSAEFTYSVNNENAVIIGYVGTNTVITVPNTIDGYPVKGIGDSAFANLTSVIEIDLPTSITSIGKSAFQNCSSLKSIKIPLGVTVISERTFYNCRSLSSIEIPSGVKTIGSYAFYCCYGLETITLPSSVRSIGEYAFFSCSTLTEMKLPSGISSLSEGIFASCSSLKSINIPNSVKSIGKRVFDYCSSLTDIKLPNGITVISASAFTGCSGLKSFVIPSTVKSIGDFAFYNCDNLTDISIPSSVTFIGDSAFSACSRLENINIPKNVKTIESYAFSDCISLKSISLPNTVTSMGNGIFRECTSLTSVTLPNSITSIPSYTFYICSSLENVVIPAAVKTIGASAFYHCSNMKSISMTGNINSIGEDAFHNCISLTKVSIPESVSFIGKEAFMNCSSLTYVNLPGNITFIDTYTFNGCSSLKSIKIPDSVTSIGSYAFADCSSLKHVVLHNNINEIGSYAFANCSTIESITLPSKLTSIEQGTFYGCAGIESIEIPAGVNSVGTYAFLWCSNLKTAYFRGDVPDDWGKDCLYPRTDMWSTFILYYPKGNTSGWTSPYWTAPDNHLYHTAAYVPPVSHEKTDLNTDEIDKKAEKTIVFLVIDPDADKPIAGAEIIFGNEKSVTDEKGRAAFKIPKANAVNMTISAQDYETLSILDYCGFQESAFDAVELYRIDSTKLIPISCNGKNICTGTAMINTKAPLTAEICVSGTAPSGILRYQLLQGEKILQENTNGHFSVSNAEFIPYEPIIAVMYTADGRTIVTALNIDVISAELINPKFPSETKNTSVPISDGRFFPAGFTWEFTNSDTEIQYEILNDSIKIGYNRTVNNKDLSDISKENKEKLELETMKEWPDNEKNNIKGFKKYVGGYIIIRFDRYGNVKDIVGNVCITLRLYSETGNTFVIPFVSIPVRVELEVTGQGIFEIFRVGYDLQNAAILWPNEISIKPEVSLKLNVGPGVRCISAGIYGKLTFDAELGILPEFTLKWARVHGEVGVYAKLDIGIVKYEPRITIFNTKDHPAILYPKREKTSSASNSLSDELDFVYDTESYSLNSREYLTYMSAWNKQIKNGTVQNSVYDSADPQIAVIGDTAVMFFLDDNGGNDPYNFQHLVFSILDDNGWSTPHPVDSNGLVDADFSVGTDGKELWVVYNQAKRLFTEEDDIEDYTAAMEIVLAKFNPAAGVFEAHAAATNNDVYDRLPSVCVTDGSVLLTWVSNSDNHIFGMTENNVIYTNEYRDGKWKYEEPFAVAENVDAITSLAIGFYKNSQATIAAIHDTDNDFTTVDDSILVQYRIGEEKQTIDENQNYSGLKFHDNQLYVSVSGTVGFFDEGMSEIFPVTPESRMISDFELVTMDNSVHIFSTESCSDSANGGSRIIETIYNGSDNTESRIQFLTPENNGYVDSFDIVALNQALVTAYRCTDVVFTEDSYTTSSDLCVQYDYFSPQLIISDIQYKEEDLFDDTTVALTVSVTNIGHSTANSCMIKAGSNSILDITKTIMSGETAKIVIDYTFPQKITKEIEVVLYDEVYNTSAAKVRLGYTDFTVFGETKQIAGTPYVSITVRNEGNMPGNDVITVFCDNVNGEVIYMEAIALDAGAQGHILLEIPDATMDKAYIEVSTIEDTEYFADDNRTFVDIIRDVSANIIYGDINKDGTVNSADSDLFAMYFAGHNVSIERTIADLNADFRITRCDAMILSRHLAGWNGYETLPVKD